MDASIRQKWDKRVTNIEWSELRELLEKVALLIKPRAHYLPQLSTPLLEMWGWNPDKNVTRFGPGARIISRENIFGPLKECGGFVCKIGEWPVQYQMGAYAPSDTVRRELWFSRSGKAVILRTEYFSVDRGGAKFEIINEGRVTMMPIEEMARPNLDFHFGPEASRHIEATISLLCFLEEILEKETPRKKDRYLSCERALRDIRELRK